LGVIRSIWLNENIEFIIWLDSNIFLKLWCYDLSR
jgi:hypothetical protein